MRRLTLELSGTTVEPSEAPARRRNEGMPLAANYHSHLSFIFL
jgi:hypothetical protein